MSQQPAVDDQFLFLGTGTSYGIPQIGCHCAVCTSSNPKNKRSRCSGLLTIDGHHMLIDVTPDFRTQALREGIDRIDAVFITHVHADHVFGLDDLRPLSLRGEEAIPIFCDKESGDQLRHIFEYIFRSEKRRPGIPWLVIREIEAGVPFEWKGQTFLPFPVEHGRWSCLGLRHRDFAYVTDAKRIPAPSLALLQGLDILCLDMLQEEKHPTHMSKEESLATVEALQPKDTWFIHMGHDIDHGPFDAGLPSGCQLAYDGKRLSLSSSFL